MTELTFQAPAKVNERFTLSPAVSSRAISSAFIVREDMSVPGYENDGFSPPLRIGSEGTTPDDIRIGVREPPIHPPDKRWYDLRNSDFLRRHSAEIYTIGWNIRQGKTPTPPIPRQIQELLPTRPSAILSPSGYMLTRPWHIPQSQGAHVSMADHRRTSEIYGMKPQGRVGANIFRATPTPWDRNLYYPTTTETEQRGQALARLAGQRNYGW